MAVAIATPGMILFNSPFRFRPMIPAVPPATAIITSNRVGEVRAISSDVASFTGEIKKNKVEVARLMNTCIISPIA